MVMGDDSCSEGRGFKSRRHIVACRHFFTLICCKNCIVCLKRSKINKKRPGLAHLKKMMGNSFATLPTYLPTFKVTLNYFCTLDKIHDLMHWRNG